jgi:outer membrane protein assembly factor BamB
MRTIRVLVLITLTAAAARGDDWPHGGRDLDRTRAPSETVDSPSLLLSVATGSATVASPVASDGFVVTAGLDGTIRAYRENDLAPVWTDALDSTVIGTPLIDHGRIYVPTTSGILWILRLADGASLGRVTTDGADQSSPVLSGGRLFMGAGFPRNELLAISAPGGSIDWHAPLDQVTNSSPAIANGKVVIGTNNGTLIAFDLATQLPIWSVNIVGNIATAAPLILGNSVFVLADGIVSKVDLDTGSVQGTLPLADTTGSAPTDQVNVDYAGSSLTNVGGLLMGLVRFDYALDHPQLPYYPSGDGFVDGWKLREFAFALDPGTMSLAWQTRLGESVEVDVNGVPLYRLLPAPVSTGTRVAFVSSIPSSPSSSTGSVSLMDPATGAVGPNLALDAPCQASPFVANARLYVMSRAGTLYAFQGLHAPPPPAANLVPSATEFAATPATLSWTSGGAGATYIVRIAHDGEVLMDWDYEFTTPLTSIPCPALADGFLYTWGVRVQDSSAAYAPWSLASFGQAVPPQPPGTLTAVPKHQKVLLSWLPTPSPGISRYLLAFGPTGGPPGPGIDLGNVTSSTVTGLSNGTSYTFEVRAVDGLGFVSPPSTAAATPVPLISIGGMTFDTLGGALAAALPGQTVQLGQDTFTIASTLHLPHDVTLRGLNALDTRLEASGPFVMIDAEQGSSVRLLSMAGGSVGVNVSASSVTIANCVVRDMTDAGIDVSGVAEIVNNTIVHNANAGVRASGAAEARNNIVQQNGAGFAGLVVSRFNDVSDGYVVSVAGQGDLNIAVSFLDAASGDYREQAGQPSLDAGSPADDFSNEPALNGGRINMGAFGNTLMAATSLTAGPPAASSGRSGGACGLTGLEVLFLLVLLRRRR